MTQEGRAARYVFGDSDAAAARLELLSEVFAPPSRALLGTVAGSAIGLAVDVGCGPGFSTRLLASEIRARKLAGLDMSAAFLRRAPTVCPGAEWYRHDVTVVPFPTGTADLLFARLVLAHLAEPEAVLVSWLGQLTTGGHLLIEEDEDIVAEHPVLQAYEEMAASLVAYRGGDLNVGRRLAALEPPPGHRRVTSQVYGHRVPAARAAQLFAMNFATWRHDPYIRRRHSAPALEALGSELARLAGSDEGGAVTFAIRQLAYRRLSE